MISLNISHDDMGLSLEESTIFYDNISKGFKHIIDTSVEYTVLESNLEKINSLYPLEIFDYSKNINITIQAFNENVILYIKGNKSKVDIKFFTKSPEVSKEVWDILSTEESDVRIEVSTLAVIRGSLSSSFKFIEKEDIEFINKDYYPYICTDALFSEYFSSPESILLLTGAPGLGKSKLATCLLQYAVENPESLPYPLSYEDPFINLVFVKGAEVLSSEEFWIHIEEYSPDFVIIDDLDNMLTTRDAEVQSGADELKNKFMNQFLSFTDGIEKRNTKFIITTNQNYRDIDSAVLREGRLFDILEMRALSREEALKIWESEGLSPEDFIEDEITAAQLSSKIFKTKHSRNNGYLLEKGISKVREAKTKRKIKI